MRRPLLDRRIAALFFFLLGAAMVTARPPSPPPYDACRLAARMVSLYPAAAGPKLVDEDLRYRLTARRNFVHWTGDVVGVLRRTTNAVGAVYRITRHVSIFGKEAFERTDIDAGSLVPLEHERQVQQIVGADRRETMLWDHIGGCLYLARYELKNGLPVKQTRARVVRLDGEVPADAMDGLAAMLYFRVRCLARSGVAPIEMYVYDGIGSRFYVTAQGAGPVTAAQATEAGASRLAPFEWHWRSLSDDGDRRLKGQLALESMALPVFFAMDIWGVEGKAELVSRVVARP